MITIPFFNPVNIWGWNDNFLALFYACLFILGGNLKPALKYWRSGALVVFSLGLNLLLQGLMPFLSFDGTTVNRFTTVTNVLTVLTAYALAGLLVDVLTKPSTSYLLSTVVIMTNSSALAVLTTIAGEKLVARSNLRTAVLTTVAIGIAFMLAGLWQWFLARQRVQKVGQQIDDLAAHDFSEQRMFLLQGLKRFGPNLTVAVIAYIVAAASMLLMNNSWHIQPNVGPTYNIFFYTFTQRGSMLIIATLLIFAVVKFIQAISKRYWISLAIVILMSCSFVIANRIKIAARNEPILSSDMAMLKVAASLFSMVTPSLWIGVTAGTAVLIGVVYWLERRHQVAVTFRGHWRLYYLLLAPILLASCLFWNHSGTPLNNLLTSLGNQPMFYNQLSGARINGPLIQFMNNVDVKVIDQPAGYFKSRMEQIVKRYQAQASKINRHRHNDLSQQTIIFNLSESFSDPNWVPGVKLKSSPIPAIKQLQANNTGG